MVWTIRAAFSTRGSTETRRIVPCTTMRGDKKPARGAAYPTLQRYQEDSQSAATPPKHLPCLHVDVGISHQVSWKAWPKSHGTANPYWANSGSGGQGCHPVISPDSVGSFRSQARFLISQHPIFRSWIHSPDELWGEARDQQNPGEPWRACRDQNLPEPLPSLNFIRPCAKRTFFFVSYLF